MVKHQHPLAEAIGTHFKASAVAGERIEARGPLDGIIRFWRIGIVFAIVEDDFKHPAGVLDLRLSRETRALACVVQQRRPVAVVDAFEIAVSGPVAIALVGLGEIDTCSIFSFILVDDGVAPVITGLADQPAKDTPRVIGVGDT